MKIDTLLSAITEIRNEDENLLKFIRSLDLSPDQKILDIGCGYGGKVKFLRSHGFSVVGVDINRVIIEANVREGIACMSADAFRNTNDSYSVLIMSHILEHFQPADLLKFMDMYLDRLQTGGYLIITTPLSSPYFYEDFDHVKPYHPTGINMVFCGKGAQVQYYARNKLKLIDLWFRRGPHKIVFSPGLYLPKYRRFPMIANIFFAVLFRLSLGIIGRTDGWMGLYKKVSPEGSGDES